MLLGIAGEEHLRTSTDSLELDWLPRRLVLVGGSYIAAEFSHVAARAGAEVIVVEQLDRVQLALTVRLFRASVIGRHPRDASSCFGAALTARSRETPFRSAPDPALAADRRVSPARDLPAGRVPVDLRAAATAGERAGAGASLFRDPGLAQPGEESGFE